MNGTANGHANADSSWTNRLPTLQSLKATIPEDLDVNGVVNEWFNSFKESLNDADKTLNLILDDAMWRDLLSFTWDMRTFHGRDAIRRFLQDRVVNTKTENFTLDYFQFLKPFPDMVWIEGTFKFNTDIGNCNGVFRIVPTASGQWKAFNIFTNLPELKDFPHQINSHRRRNPIPGLEWFNRRKEEIAYANRDPAVLVIGAGQSGLSIAARLKFLNVPTLLIEKDARVGDSWRNRYTSLCLHFPVWNDHMPYINFPPTWPVYTPSYKMAEWLEGYAKSLELDIWTSSTVLDASQDDDKKWTVRVQKGDGSIRTFRVNHLVFATGIGDGCPNMPDIANEDQYSGKIMHSTGYRDSEPFKGKKVTVIGTGNSGHDIAYDLSRNGIDVTMVQRSPTFVMNMDEHWKYLGGMFYREDGPPIERADMLYHSIPYLLQEGGFAQRSTKMIMDSQKERFEKLRNTGYRVGPGIKEGGFALQMKERGGGHCFDHGSIQMIIDGKIKVRNLYDSPIKGYYANGLEFEDGSRIDSDVVVCATGIGDTRQMIGNICGDSIAKECPPLLGVNDEGEANWCRPLSRTGLWYIMGSLQVNRFYSNPLAIQIKAMEEKILGERY
ncbi:FAD/NAD-binding domain-containing protein [Marasmius fiardii PR-910]|nr:FAD/NAD-binding domain-containing protein [Marasmius fiardii PR-910]